MDLDDSLSGGVIAGTHIEFQGRAPDDFGNGGQGGHHLGPGSGPAVSNVINGNVPSLKPNERAGQCQRYTGSVCQEHLVNNFIFVSEGLTQDYIEQKLQASLQVIKKSSELSKNCAKYAIPAICLSTLPLCDVSTQKPRKVRTILIQRMWFQSWSFLTRLLFRHLFTFFPFLQLLFVIIAQGALKL